MTNVLLVPLHLSGVGVGDAAALGPSRGNSEVCLLGSELALAGGCGTRPCPRPGTPPPRKASGVLGRPRKGTPCGTSAACWGAGHDAAQPRALPAAGRVGKAQTVGKSGLQRARKNLTGTDQAIILRERIEGGRHDRPRPRKTLCSVRRTGRDRAGAHSSPVLGG